VTTKTPPLTQHFNEAVILSKGYAIGPLRFLSTIDRILAAEVQDHSESKTDISEAIKIIRQDLERILNENNLTDIERDSFSIQLKILASIENKLINKKLAKNLNSENGFYDHLKAYYEELTNNPMADNIRPVPLRLMAILSHIPFDDLSQINEGDIVYATALTLKQASDLFNKKIAGLITSDDPADGHLKAIALQHGIPCITGLARKQFIREENDEHTAIIDGVKGSLIIDPNEQTLREYHDLIDASRARRKEQEKHATDPCETRDGHYVSILANVNDLNFRVIKSYPVDGVGLVRLEIIFAEHAKPIGSSEQRKMIEDACHELGQDRPVVLRLLDVNKTDKHPDQILHGSQRDRAVEKGEAEGLEFLLKNEGLLLNQMRSLILAGSQHPIKILVPAARNLMQISKVRSLFKGVYQDILSDEDSPIGIQKPPLGFMIETADITKNPTTIKKAIKQSDFISVGTNDLSHEIANKDRYDDKTKKDTHIEYNPRFIKALNEISQACLKEQKEMSICGNLASDIEFLPLVLALRMKPVVLTQQIYDVRERISQLTLSDCDSLLNRVLGMTSRQEIKEEVKKFNQAITQTALSQSPPKSIRLPS